MIERYDQAPMQVMMGVGRVSQHTARLWLRCPGAVSGTLVLTRRDGSAAPQTHPLHLDPAPDRDGTHAVQLDELGFELHPDTPYELQLRTDGLPRSCRFRTACPPGHEGRICFAVGSCHNPYQSDGYDHAPSLAFLRALPDAVESWDARHVFLVGDQVYSDLPPGTSLFDDDVFRSLPPEGVHSIFDASRAQVRAVYQRRHRSHWKHAEWQALQASAVTTMLLDDHDIVDNFGTAPEHAEPRWTAIREGALDAYHDYQASRALDGPRGAHAGSVVDVGRVRVVQVDVRSERHVTDGAVKVLDQGATFLREAMASAADRSVLCIVLPVPIGHWPEGIIDAARRVEGEGGDAADRWSSAPLRDARDRLLGCLHDHQLAHPEQRMILLAGDTHVGAIGTVRWRSAAPDLLQLVSSALTNEQSAVTKAAATAAPRFVHPLTRAGEREPYAEVTLLADTSGTNPFPSLNLGFVEVARRGGGDKVRLSLVGSSLEPPGWQTVCQTDWL